MNPKLIQKQTYIVDNKKFKSLPAWVRQISEDLYGKDPEAEMFILPYELDKPVQEILKDLGRTDEEYRIAIEELDLRVLNIEYTLKNDKVMSDPQFDNNTYVLSFKLLGEEGRYEIDLPIESLIKNARLDGNNLILTLDNGNEITVPLNSLITGLAKEDEVVKLTGNQYNIIGDKRFDSLQIMNSKGLIFVNDELRSNGKLQVTGGKLNILESTKNGEIAVMSDLDSKLDKVSSTSAFNQAYVKTLDGSQTMVNISNLVTNNAIVQRNSDGYFLVRTATQGSHPVSLEQLDLKLEKYNERYAQVKYQSSSSWAKVAEVTMPSSSIGNKSVMFYVTSENTSGIISEKYMGIGEWNVLNTQASNSFNWLAVYGYSPNNFNVRYDSSTNKVSLWVLPTTGLITLHLMDEITNGSHTDDVVLFRPTSGETRTGITLGNSEVRPLAGMQATLVSGDNIKTINSQSLLGSGNIETINQIKTINGTTMVGTGNVTVQPTLVSGNNIKTINGASLLGNGDISMDAVDLPEPQLIQSIRIDGSELDYSNKKTYSVDFNKVRIKGALGEGSDKQILDDNLNPIDTFKELKVVFKIYSRFASFEAEVKRYELCSLFTGGYPKDMNTEFDRIAGYTYRKEEDLLDNNYNRL